MKKLVVFVMAMAVIMMVTFFVGCSSKTEKAALKAVLAQERAYVLSDELKTSRNGQEAEGLCISISQILDSANLTLNRINMKQSEFGIYIR